MPTPTSSADHDLAAELAEALREVLRHYQGAASATKKNYNAANDGVTKQALRALAAFERSRA